MSGVLFAASTGSWSQGEPAVTMRFSGFTDNNPESRQGLFQESNLSPFTVRLFGCVVDGELVQMDPVEFRGNETKSVLVALPRARSSANRKVQFEVRSTDTWVEEAREGLDGTLRKLSIRFPGLNPDSTLKTAILLCEIPSELSTEPPIRPSPSGHSQ